MTNPRGPAADTGGRVPDTRGPSLAPKHLQPAQSTRAAQPAQPAQPAQSTRAAQPTALLYGPGHKIVHANAAFVAEFGIVPIGVPAAEALLDLPPLVLQVVERVIGERRALATFVEVRGGRHRLTVAPRSDIETGEVYGVALRLARE